MESTGTTGGAGQRETDQSSDPLAQALLQEEVLERDQVLAIVNGAQNIPSGAR